MRPGFGSPTSSPHGPQGAHLVLLQCHVDLPASKKQKTKSEKQKVKQGQKQRKCSQKKILRPDSFELETLRGPGGELTTRLMENPCCVTFGCKVDLRTGLDKIPASSDLFCQNFFFFSRNRTRELQEEMGDGGGVGSQEGAQEEHGGRTPEI